MRSYATFGMRNIFGEWNITYLDYTLYMSISATTFHLKSVGSDLALAICFRCCYGLLGSVGFFLKKCGCYYNLQHSNLATDLFTFLLMLSFIEQWTP
jgi:hypothetical protein